LTCTLHILTEFQHDLFEVIHHAAARMCHFTLDKPWRKKLGTGTIFGTLLLAPTLKTIIATNGSTVVNSLTS